MSDTRLTVMEAVSRQKLITALYNGALIRLAPHLLFQRHGDLFVSALNLSKAWRSEDEKRLGQFKLAGLIDATLLDQGFEPLPDYAAVVPRTDDVLILSI